MSKGTNTYNVTLIFTASRYVKIRAESEDRAKEIAADEYGCPSLCHHCSDHLEIDDLREIEVEEDSP